MHVSPAQPVLASTLYDLALKRKQEGDEATYKSKRICTGIKPIDDLVLCGGFAASERGGAVVGLAVERNESVEEWEAVVST